jgi:HK97 family phage portal protein
MSLLQRLRSWFGRVGRSVRASAKYYNPFRSWFEPKNIFTSQTTSTLATNETIFSAISQLANGMASMPLKLLKDFEEQHNQMSDMMANSPNPNVTSFDWIRTMETLRNAFGNAIALKEYDGRYQVRALWILDPTRVTPMIETDTKELWYRIEGENGAYYVHNMDVIHVKHIHTSGYWGISPLDVLRGTVDFDTKIRAFSLKQIEGAIHAGFILNIASMVDQKKKEEILNNFKSFYQENGGVLFEETGVAIREIQARQYIDPKLFEVAKITITRVATVFNMPPHRLGLADGASYNAMEQRDMEYVQGTLMPIAKQYEQELNRKLLTPEQRRAGYYWKFNLNALLRGDFGKRMEGYFKGIRSGFYTPNDVRRLEDLPPVPEGGDELYISKDLLPLKQLIAGNLSENPPPPAQDSPENSRKGR